MPRRSLSLALLLIGLAAVAGTLLRQSPAPAQTIDPFADQYQSTRPLKTFDDPKLPDKIPDTPPSKSPPTLKKGIDYIKFTAALAPAQARRGQVVRVTIKGETPPYAYTYSALKRHYKQSGLSDSFTFAGGGKWLRPMYPVIEEGTELKKTKVDTAFILHEKFQWQQDLYISPDAPIGEHTIDLDIDFQVCTTANKDAGTGDSCFPPHEKYPIKLRLVVEDGPVVTPAPDEKVFRPPTVETPPPDLTGFLIGAFIGAILMLLTPCVFPMIPITVNYFIKQSEKEHHRPFFMASVYAGTIVILLTAVILLVGKSIIDLANAPWFNLGLGLILIMFALSLFGLFDVDLSKFFGAVFLLVVAFGISTLAQRFVDIGGNQFVVAMVSLGIAVPTTMLLGNVLRRVERAFGFEESMLLNFLTQQESRGGMLGAAFMAMTFTITSFSCTGPFLGILLAPLAGTSFTPVQLLLAALVYSCTFAAPFFFLALFPTYLKKLPKSGGWMTTIKVTMGFLEIGAALKFLANTDLFWFPGNPQFFNYDTVLCSWIALSLGCSLYLFGFFHLHHDTPEDHIGVPRMIFASLFLGMSVYLVPLLFGVTPRGLVMESAVAFLPPDLKKHSEIPWIEDNYTEAYNEAKREGKLIFIDFTGQNCANCRANERNAFMKPNVIKQMKNYVCLQLYTDSVPNPDLTPDQARAQGLKQQNWQIKLIKDVTNPAYVIFDPDPSQEFEDGVPKGFVVRTVRGLITNPREFAKILENP